ncbi:hypothetical protein FN846DRAFT_931759 [Sphaerosporella brunnea]|uniref:Uncharacterized protein n=1 Tax=Sphaerosporella brunnea TaxID=1250544 RepID=A0A5J5F7W4_9PEZI|nr:hypothetical protein FN846DRAFT_931759 [Sphaerosporella brunnea]
MDSYVLPVVSLVVYLFVLAVHPSSLLFLFLLLPASTSTSARFLTADENPDVAGGSRQLVLEYILHRQVKSYSLSRKHSGVWRCLPGLGPQQSQSASIHFHLHFHLHFPQPHPSIHPPTAAAVAPPSPITMICSCAKRRPK